MKFLLSLTLACMILSVTGGWHVIAHAVASAHELNHVLAQAQAQAQSR